MTSTLALGMVAAGFWLGVACVVTTTLRRMRRRWAA